MTTPVSRRTARFWAGVCLLSLVGHAHAQESRPASVQDEEGRPGRVLSIARDLMSASRFCTLVTLDAHGEPQARIMDPLPPDGGFSVYVATNPLSRKVREIRRHPRVTLLYFDSPRPGYVTLIGRAVEVKTADKKGHHKPEWEPFFPAEKPEAYVLFRIVPLRLEVVSARDGLPGDPATWRPEIVEFK